MSDNQPVKVLHTFGSKPCGEPAFLWAGDEPPIADTPISDEHIRLLDKRKPSDTDPCVCGSCGEALRGTFCPIPIEPIAEALNKAKAQDPPILSDFF